MAVRSEALSRCKACIDGKKSFLLQGGAGSGKTESLKELLLYIRQTQPQARVVCITHTNAAVAEILDRVGEGYVVSTIHSFLYGLVSGYRKNLWQVVPKLFKLEPVVAGGDHAQYKSLYEACRKMRFRIDGTTAEDPVHKKAYEKDPASCDQTLNDMIGDLNRKVDQALALKEMPADFYNMTKFDSFRSVTFGHDGLLTVFHMLFERYDLFRRIIRDKYDYIFIDEYQDTNAVVLKDLLRLPRENGLTVGLFGDHMQSIYEKGIDSLDAYISDGTIESIPKKDNYRCSDEVVKLINTLRTDEIEQEVAFKQKKDGTDETAGDRRGSARVWYTLVNRKPDKKSTPAEKQDYYALLETLIAKAQAEMGGKAKVLLLTNKEIAERNGFPTLHRIFHERYSDAKEMIEDRLRKVQALEVAELCRLFEQKQYNELICRAKANGYAIRTLRDREVLRKVLEKLCTDQKLSMWDAVQLAISYRLIEQTEACDHEARWEERWQTTPRYEEFLKHCSNGRGTYTELHKVWEDLSKDEFKELDSKRKKERFCRALFSEELKFAEIRKYDTYLEEETGYITMHRTKGSSIRSVIVVMEEYFWTEYNFRTIYDPAAGKPSVRERSEKLIYVACSRAAKDLICLRILTPDEEEAFRAKFPQAEKIEL